MEMREQTAAVKKELLRAGFDNNNLSVTRGKGTASWWIHVNLDIVRSSNCTCGVPDMYGRRETCQPCKDKWMRIKTTINNISLKASERDNDEYQNITIQLGFKEATT
jgi:hypothetical protein